MAKEWGLRSNERAKMQKKHHSAKIARSIDIELYKRNDTPRPGIKTSVLMVYSVKGKLAAWQALQEFNKKISGQGFTMEMLEQWIGEYENRQAQRIGKDDGYDR